MSTSPSPVSGDSYPGIHLLQLFDALYRTRNVSRAAETLGISQPTASTWLKQLRRHFNDELFVRRGGAMHPTSRAEDVAPTAREAIEAMRTLSRNTREFDAGSSQRTFRLHCPDGTHLSLLPSLCARIGREAPTVHLTVSMLSESPEEDLRANATDLIVAVSSRALQREFRSQVLSEQGWLCLMRRDHLAASDDFDAAHYRTCGHVNVRQSGWSHLLDSSLAAQSWSRRVAVDMPGVLGVPDLLSSTDLVATMPAHIATLLARDSRLTLAPCPVQVPRFSVCMYWSHRYDNDQGHRWLRNLVSDRFLEPELGLPAIR